MTVHMTPPVEPNKHQISINMESIRRKHVVFAVPMYGGVCTESTMMSFIQWGAAASQYQVDWSIMSMSNESLVPRARNTLTARFLVDYPQGTHLFWVDADVGFKPEHVFTLLNHNVDVVAGLYPMKTFPLKWCVNAVENPNPNIVIEGLTEVLTAGTGFMCISRGVFEKLKSHPNVVQYANDTGIDVKYDREMYTWWDCRVRDGRYLSEDWKFCYDWRDLGGQIYIDKRVLLTHTGPMVYCNETAQHLSQTMGLDTIKRLQQQYNLRIVDPDGKIVNLTP